jgi:hypothetical protein
MLQRNNKKRKREKIFKTDILDDDEKEKKGLQVLRNVEKDTQIKTYNLDTEVIKR